jgi:sec-independent protein translocase protein TatA
LRPAEEVMRMFGIGMTELLVILAIVLVIFGANKLPEIGKGMGQAIGNFKKSMKEANEIDVTPEKKKLEGDEKKS